MQPHVPLLLQQPNGPAKPHPGQLVRTHVGAPPVPGLPPAPPPPPAPSASHTLPFRVKFALHWKSHCPALQTATPLSGGASHGAQSRASHPTRGAGSAQNAVAPGCCGAGQHFCPEGHDAPSASHDDDPPDAPMPPVAFIPPVATMPPFPIIPLRPPVALPPDPDVPPLSAPPVSFMFPPVVEPPAATRPASRVSRT